MNLNLLYMIPLAFGNDVIPALILFVFIGKRGYYCDREYVYDMIGTRSTLEDLVNAADDAAEISYGLQLRASRTC